MADLQQLREIRDVLLCLCLDISVISIWGGCAGACHLHRSLGSKLGFFGLLYFWMYSGLFRGALLYIYCNDFDFDDMAEREWVNMPSDSSKSTGNNYDNSILNRAQKYIITEY